jgi:hypothetical protein
MLRNVALVGTDVSEECLASIIRVTRLGKLRTMLAVTSNQNTLRRNSANTDPSTPILVPLEDGGDMFLQNVVPYKGHTA